MCLCFVYPKIPVLPTEIMSVYPITSAMTPTSIPVTNICLVFIRPVEYAMALGGVLIGRDIANDAAIATPTSNVPTPP